MKRDKKLYKHIYNFVKLREMNLPSAYEYQEKYGLRFNETDVEDSFFREAVNKSGIYIYNVIYTGRAYDSLAFCIILLAYIFLELFGLLPVTMPGRIITLVISVVIQYALSCLFEYISRRIKTDYLYLVHTGSHNGGTSDERY